MSDKIGIESQETSELQRQINEIEEIIENITNENEKFVSWLDAMESKYIEKQVDEIDAVERETKQLRDNMNELINGLIDIKNNICDEDEYSKIS